MLAPEDFRAQLGRLVVG